MAAVVGSVLINLDVNTQPLGKFSAAATKVAADTAHMREAMSKVGSEASNSFVKAGQAVVAFNGHFSGLANQLRSIGLLMGSFDTTAVAAGAGFASAAAGLGIFVSTADKMKRQQNDLRTVTNSYSELFDVQKALFDISQRSRAAMDSTVTLYARTARAVKAFGISQQDTLRMTETVQKAFAIGGATPEEAAGAAIQLSQGIASNRFSGDEYRSVAENAPVLLNGIAKQLGVTIGGLRKLAVQGKLTGDVVAKAIVGASADIDAQFAKTDSTVGQSMQRIHNSFDEYVYNTDKALGVTTKLASAINLLADNFSTAGNAGLALITTVGALAAGRIGSSIIGRKNSKTGELGGIRGQIAYGLFNGSRTAAQKELESLKQNAEDYKKELVDVSKQIEEIQGNGGLTGKGAEKVINARMSQSNALSSTRSKVIAANEKINDLAKQRLALNERISAVESGIADALKAEQAESLNALKISQLSYNNATRTFKASPSADNLNNQIEAYGKLQAAKAAYENSKTRALTGAGGEFDYDALKAYGSEIDTIYKQLDSNQKAQVRASADLLKAQDNYVAAQRLSPDIQDKTRIEMEKSATVLNGLKERQVQLNTLIADTGTKIEVVGTRISVIGNVMSKLKGLGLGLFNLIGGGPGLILTAAITGIGLIASHIANANQETKDWEQELKDAGFLAEDVAKSASNIDEAIKTKNLASLQEKLKQINVQMDKLQRGTFFSKLSDSLTGNTSDIESIADKVEFYAQRNSNIAQSQHGSAKTTYENKAADEARFAAIIKGASQSKQITTELDNELREIASHDPNFFNPLLLAFEKMVTVLKAGAEEAGKVKKGIADIGNPAQIPDGQRRAEDEKRYKTQGDFFSTFFQNLDLSPYDAAIQKKAQQLQKKAQQDQTPISDAVATVLANLDMANDASKKGLRDLIGFTEGTDKARGYNETLGYGRFTGGDVNLTQMTLGDVLQLQSRMLEQTRALSPNDPDYNSSAVGRYQITQTTLNGLIDKLGLSLSDIFTPAMQDRLANELIRETGGSPSKLQNIWPSLSKASPQNIQTAIAKTELKLPAVDPNTKKWLDEIKDLDLQKSIAQMDDFDKSVVEAAKKSGASEEQIKALIVALTTNDLSKVPAKFRQIAEAIQQIDFAKVSKALKDAAFKDSVSFLSDIGQKTVSLAQSAGVATPIIQKYIDALTSGDLSQVPAVMQKIQDSVTKTAHDQDLVKFADGAAEAFGSLADSWITGSKSMGDALKDLGKKLLELVAQLLIIEPMVERLKTLFRGGVSDTGSSGGFDLFGIIGKGISSLLGLGSSGSSDPWAGLRLAGGGAVSGFGSATSDSIPAMLSNGEFVVNAAATKRFGPLLNAINSGTISHFASGGIAASRTSVPDMSGAVASAGSSAFTFAPVTHIDARGSNMSEAEMDKIVQRNNKQLLDRIQKELPDRMVNARKSSLKVQRAFS